MNSFGRLFRVTIFGESHGEYVGTVIDGCPAGVKIEEADFFFDLQRRHPGKKGTTDRKEDDTPLIKSGVFEGRTTGAPIIILFENRRARPVDYEEIRFLPRPGHADFVAHKKYEGLNDFRGGGHFSGRITVGIVAAGVIAKKLIEPTKVEAHLTQVHGRQDIEKAIEEAERDGDSVGGIVECRVQNVPVGLGEPFFDTCESLLSHMIFAIPGIKGIEFGKGFEASKMRGSEFNDVIVDRGGKTVSNNSGGINGGITNGSDIFFRVAVRPTPSIRKKQMTIDLRTGEKREIEIRGRHDICFAIRMPPIIEAATSIVIADLMLIEQRLKRIIHERD